MLTHSSHSMLLLLGNGWTAPPLPPQKPIHYPIPPHPAIWLVGFLSQWNKMGLMDKLGPELGEEEQGLRVGGKARLTASGTEARIRSWLCKRISILSVSTFWVSLEKKISCWISDYILWIDAHTCKCMTHAALCAQHNNFHFQAWSLCADFANGCTMTLFGHTLCHLIDGVRM